jgi:pyruvate,water dikinase
MTSQEAELRFDPPGPGAWALDPLHFPRPVTRYWTEMHPEPFIRGFRHFTAYYGMLIDYVEMQYVNGFAYRAIHPVTAEEFPRRVERAAEAFERRLWRDQLHEWEDSVKPASIKVHRDLQSVDPDALSDEDLSEYLSQCRNHHADMITQHMRFTGAAMLPIGDLIAHVAEWTGLHPADLLPMMRGAAPVSGGASAELDHLIEALRKDPKAMHMIESDQAAAETLGTLRALDSETGRALSGYLDLVGCRLLDGFDISGRYALEMPDALLRAIRSSVAGRQTDSTDVEDQIADIRAKVPEPQRQMFDELLTEARLMYRIRDERGVFSDIWASGLMRRGAMAAGRRLAGRGRIADPEHFIDADIHEMRALLAGGGPSPDELAERYGFRMAHTAKDAPAAIGDPEPPMPDPSGLPPAAARMMRAIGTSMGNMGGLSDAPHEGDRIRGLAASGGVYEGPARRVTGPSEFDRIVQGDVLLTESTSEAFNILLPLLGALVTDSGGLLSHPAIVAREYGIPGVVGTRDATDRIPDGARVRVDGNAGEVTILE